MNSAGMWWRNQVGFHEQVSVVFLPRVSHTVSPPVLISIPSQVFFYSPSLQRAFQTTGNVVYTHFRTLNKQHVKSEGFRARDQGFALDYMHLHHPEFQQLTLTLYIIQSRLKHVKSWFYVLAVDDTVMQLNWSHVFQLIFQTMTYIPTYQETVAYIMILI